MDIISATRRLNIIKNFVLLGGGDEIPAQAEKLRHFSSTLNLSEILDALDEGKLKILWRGSSNFVTTNRRVLRFQISGRKLLLV